MICHLEIDVSCSLAKKLLTKMDALTCVHGETRINRHVKHSRYGIECSIHAGEMHVVMLCPMVAAVSRASCKVGGILSICIRMICIICTNRVNKKLKEHY